MLDRLLKRLNELHNKEVSIPIGVDAKGYSDRKCPDQKCQYYFKVNDQDWENKFKDQAVYCPKCRHEASGEKWWTPEQLQEAEKQALKYIEGEISQALRKDAKEFNRDQNRASFIKMSMHVSGLSRLHNFMPIPAQEEMQLEIECESCSARYAVIGLAFFCPCCGYNSVEKTFVDSIKKVGIKVDNLNFIRQAFKDDGRADEGEITCMTLLETSLSDLIVAFQRYSEETYKTFTHSSTVAANAFQRLNTGSDLWELAVGEGYNHWLNRQELQELNILFQKRHLLAHREGMVDDKYIIISNDHSYQIGQRISISEKDIKSLIALLNKIVFNIKSKI